MRKIVIFNVNIWYLKLVNRSVVFWVVLCGFENWLIQLNFLLRIYACFDKLNDKHSNLFCSFLSCDFTKFSNNQNETNQKKFCYFGNKWNGMVNSSNSICSHLLFLLIENRKVIWISFFIFALKQSEKIFSFETMRIYLQFK